MDQQSEGSKNMSIPDRKRMEVLNAIFERFALEDQQNYYRKRIMRSRKAFRQVNTIRAGLAFMGGLASAVVGLLAALNNESVTLVTIFIAIAVLAPAAATAFASYASLFDYERMITIYEKALDNIYLADALSPLPDMSDAEYYMYLQAFADATLDIMFEETAQFGNLVRSSQQIDDFLQKSRERATTTTNRFINPTPPEAEA